MPAGNGGDGNAVARTIRRLYLAALLDRSMSREELEAQIRGLIDGVRVRLSSGLTVS
jgi:hypothetical protein